MELWYNCQIMARPLSRRRFRIFVRLYADGAKAKPPICATAVEFDKLEPFGWLMDDEDKASIETIRVAGKDKTTAFSAKELGEAVPKKKAKKVDNKFGDDAHAASIVDMLFSNSKK